MCKTGTEKLLQDMERGNCFALIDPHGERKKK